MTESFDISVVICTHNPRQDYLRRVLSALKAQTLTRHKWELLLIDNASSEPLAKGWDLSWHPHARLVREDESGLTPARLRGIAEARSDLLVFVDDDNVLASNYLECALAIASSHPYLGVFGAGVSEPEFEAEPDPKVRPMLFRLALRNVPRALWTNNVADYDCSPAGAGLCVPRRIAKLYSEIVIEIRISKVLDRNGGQLFCGGDDLFSWLSAGDKIAFGIFPELRILHLISAERVRQDYFERLFYGHAFSHAILNYQLFGKKPPARTAALRLVAHGLKHGGFSMRCRHAEAQGGVDAARYILDNGLRTLPLEKNPIMKPGVKW